MRSDERVSTGDQEDEDDNESIREIQALTRSPPPPPHRRRSSSLSETENFTTMSREFNALVLAGTESELGATSTDTNHATTSSHLGRIGEEEIPVESFHRQLMAIVASPATRGGGHGEVISVEEVKKGEVESKISAWQNAKIAKINSRFKRDDAIINGWENEQVRKSTSWMKKIERKLETKHARALEEMENDIAKTRRKTEEKKATSEAKRGTKVARVLEVANLMRAVGRPPTKRYFF